MSDLFEKLKQLPSERLLLVVKELQERLDAQEEAAREPIAIVGASCRFPGADGLDAYWKLLSEGRDAIREVPSKRMWDKARYFDPNPDALDKTYVWRGGFLDNVEYFAPGFFGIAHREALRMDPQQRLLLECVWEAIENAGQPIRALQQCSTGVYVGISTNDFLQIGCRNNHGGSIDPYSGTGTTASIAAGRISYCLGLEGPNFPVDTACSSSLVALHLACQALRGGDSDAAIVAAINLMLAPETTVYFSKVRALSPDGICHTFDAAANGYVRSEGVAALVLKRLSDAVRQNDPILAIIRGSAINHDGRTSGLTVPNRASQERLLRDALRNAGLQPHDIHYIEAHGTGTPLGDPIELQALGAVFRESHDARRPLLVGSAKTNVGHAEAAAGLVGVLKVVLSLMHRRLPPHLHFQQPNPYIPWAQLPIEIPTQLRPWPGQSPLRAGVSSFGFSGTNSHVLLEEAPTVERRQVAQPRHVLCLSAKSKPALEQLVSRAAEQLEGNSLSLADACYTAAAGRTHFAHRLTIAAESKQQAIAQLRAMESGQLESAEVSPDSRPKVAFLFSGHPAAWRDLAELRDSRPAFREALAECDAALEARTGRKLQEFLAASRTTNATFAQPALLALQYALGRMWIDWGVRPGIVLGHSDGEYAAACLAGVMKLADAFELLLARNSLLDAVAGGGMLAVKGAPKQIADLLDAESSQLCVAAINSADQFVVSGAAAAIERLEAACTERQIATQRLAIATAYHSPLIDGMLPEYEQCLGKIAFEAPTLGFLSTATGNLEQQALTQTGYWRTQLRSPVRFHESLLTLNKRKYDVVLEIGPSDTTALLTRQVLGASGPQAIATLRKDTDGATSLLDAARALYMKGVDVDWKRFHAGAGASIAAWPTYPFQREALLELPEGQTLPAGAEAVLPAAQRPAPAPSPVPQTQTEQPAASLSPFEWIYETQWTQLGGASLPAAEAPAEHVAAAGASAGDETEGIWVVLADTGGLAEAVAAKLIERGQRVQHVRRDNVCRVESGGEWTIDPTEPEHVGELLAAISRYDVPCRGIVQLWSTDPDGDLQADQDRGCYTLLNLVQAMATRALPGTPRLVVATRGAQSVRSDDRLSGLNQSSLWGLARVVALEHPHLRTIRIDLDETCSDRNAEASRLLALLDSASGEDQLALRTVEGQLEAFVPRLNACAATVESLEPRRISGSATYLITGGLGGLGLLLAPWLVEQGARHLALVGRSKPSEAAEAVLAQLRHRGVQVRVLQGDIAVETDVRRIVSTIAAEMPPLKGIIHAAGALADGPILQMTRDQFHAVLRPKTVGTLHLDRATREAQLDFFVGFSSIASLLSSPHQANYAAANAFLDALMHQRRQQGLPGLSINWGPWREAGMAARTAQQGSGGWRALGIEMLESEQAWQVLPRLLSSPSAQLGVIPTDWSRLFQLFPPGLEPPILKNLVRAGRQMAPPSAAWNQLWEQLEALPPSEHLALVEHYVSLQVMDTLGGTEVEPTAGLSDAGMDSLMAVDLRTKLQTDVGFDVVLPVTFAFEQPSIREISNWLFAKVIEPRLSSGKPAPVVKTKASEPPQPLAADHDAASAEPAPASIAPPAQNGHAHAAATNGHTPSSRLPAPPRPGRPPLVASPQSAVENGNGHPRDDDPIAIVGMACRFPGGINSLDDYWQALASGRDCISQVPASRWNADAWYDPNPDAPARMNTRYGGFIDDVENFDADFFGISPREAIRMDPQQRLLLEVMVHALEHARIPVRGLAGSDTGVFVGISGNDYIGVLRRASDLEMMDAFLATGNAPSIAAGRLAHALGFNGPCLAIDTACSSSLVAVHLAAESVRSGRSAISVAGGVGLILGPEVTVSLTKARAMSPDGRCKTFDASANGYVRGEGCGLVVLERLSRAVAAGHKILAVIEASAINHDGRSSGLTVPNRTAQEALLRSALDTARLASGDIDYVEAHGTGTPLGDPIELQSVGAVYGAGRKADRPLRVGSVKTNLGHLEAAAGVAGLIKTVLAMQHGVIPPHLHFHQPNPYIPWHELPVEIPRKCLPWDNGSHLRRAGVSSFGFSGTNAHVLIGDHPGAEAATEHVSTSDQGAGVLCLSAHSVEALTAHAANVASMLRERPDTDIAALCRAAHLQRSHESHRLVVQADNAAGIALRLEQFAAGAAPTGLRAGQVQKHPRPRVAMLFTGQGSQFAGMARQLYATQPRFREVIDECDRLLSAYWDRSLVDLITVDDPATEALLTQTHYTQPALFAFEIALAELWRSWGVTAGAVLGHSVGEYAAACFAGMLSLDDGIRFIVQRASLMGALPGGGAMAAVRADERQVKALLAEMNGHMQGAVEIAAVNGPSNTVISGPSADLQTALAHFASRGVSAVALKVSHAFHSAAMEPVLSQLGQVAEELSWSAPTMGVVSNLTGKFLTADQAAQPAYWCEHLRRPVRFSDGINTLEAAGYTVMLEVGPQPVLLGMAKACYSGQRVDWLASQRKAGAAGNALREALGTLYLRGVPIDWNCYHEQLTDGAAPDGIDLPLTPFQRKRYWPETEPYLPPGAEQLKRPAASADAALRADAPSEPTAFLGKRIRSPLFREMVYERPFSQTSPSFVRDHQVHSMLVVPGASHLAMAVEAAAAEGMQRVHLENVSFSEALILEDETPRNTQFIVDPPDHSSARRWKFISESPDDPTRWLTHADGHLGPCEESPAEAAIDLESLKARCPHFLPEADLFYQLMLRNGLQFGASFKWNKQLWRENAETLSRLELPEGCEDRDVDTYAFFPGLIDSCIQLIGFALPANVPDNGAYVPVLVRQFDVYRPPSRAMWCHFKLVEQGDRASSYTGDWSLYDDDGKLIARAVGMRFQRAPRTALMAFVRRRLRDWLYRLRWIPLPIPNGTPTQPIGPTLIFSDGSELAERLVAELRQQGVDTCLVQRGNGPLRPLSENGDGLSISIDPTSPGQFDELLEHATQGGTKNWKNVIYLWAQADEPQFDAVDVDDLELAISNGLYPLFDLARRLARTRHGQPPKLWVVTRGVQRTAGESACRIGASPLWGFCRVLTLEAPQLACMRIDLDAAESIDGELGQLLQEMCSVGREDQIAFRGGVRHVARLLRGTDTTTQSGATVLDGGDEPYRMAKSERGMIDDLSFRPMGRPTPLSGEVEVAVQATGMNFRDVLNVLNLYPGEAGPPGLECAGIVTRVGQGVTNVKPGDRVAAIALGCFSQYVVTDARLVAPLPESVSFEDGAGLPIVFSTVLYSLVNLAQLKRGETVLVHSAAGGIGHAAIEVARKIGATVIATAGSPQKREHVQACGVEHVFDSRNWNFSEKILEVTGGRGVDVVLNFLPGDAIAENLKALARNGRMVEIGKIDIWDDHRVASVRPDVDYHVVAFDSLAAHQPDLVGELLRETVETVGSDVYKAPPCRVFDLADVQDAFRYMAAAKHIGKIVVRHPSALLNDGNAMRASGTWLMTGGLGALGLRIARLLVDQGVRRIVLAGRRQPDERTAAMLEEMRGSGAEVLTVAADVSEQADVDRLMQLCDADDEAPLRGVVHLAGVLDDGIIENLNHERFAAVLRPKCQGAWRLHMATRHRKLDAFLLFSSAASLLGSPGQANYAAANAFLDALAHARRAAGLKATSINWGPWAESGMATRLRGNTHQQWEMMGLTPVSPDDGAAVLQMLVEEDVAQAGVLPINWQQLLNRFPPGTEPPVLSAIAGERRNPAEPSKEWVELVEKIEAAPPAERVDMLVSYMQQSVGGLLGFDQSQKIDPHTPLNELGFDSLMAVEMANKFTSASGAALPVTLLFDYPTLYAMAGYLLREVLKLEGAEVAAPKPALREAPQSVEQLTESLLEQIDQMSDEQVREQIG